MIDHNLTNLFILFSSFRLLRGRSYLGVFLAFLTSGASLYFFEVTSKWSVFFNFIFLFIAGAANCGPDLVVSGSLATEVAKAANAESAVAGLVNGGFFSTYFRFYSGTI